MNSVINTLTNHRSFRTYEDKKVKQEELDAILNAAQSAPTWIHGQQVSIIVIQNKERKQRLAELCGNQDHINQAPVFLVFCADFYRAKLASEMEDVPFDAINDTDILMVGATDVGIALSNAIASAESLGLGTVPIGGIRKNPLEVVDLLNLPEYVIPISGLCLGYPAEDPGIKPRLPKETFVHSESYNSDQQNQIESFNEIFRQDLLKKSNGVKDITWTKFVSNFYKGRHYNNNYKDVPDLLKQQGFTCKDLK